MFRNYVNISSRTSIIRFFLDILGGHPYFPEQLDTNPFPCSKSYDSLDLFMHVQKKKTVQKLNIRL